MTALSRRTLLSGLAGFSAAAVIGSCGGQAVTASPTRRLRRIGYLSGNKQNSVEAFSTPFLQKMRELGYAVETHGLGVDLQSAGRDLEIVFKIANQEMDRLPAMLAELIAMPVDVIVAEAGPAQRAAKQATVTVPIVFTLSADPVAAGLVASLARPGGNITGVTTGNIEGAAKRVELLKATVPTLTRLTILWNANQSDQNAQVSATEKAAQLLGIETQVVGLHDPAETDAALDAIELRPRDGLLMLPTLSVVRPDYKQVPQRVAKMQLPAIYSEAEIVRAGGLMHRSPDYADGHRRAAVMVDKILRGARPADIPVEEPTQFLFAVNLAAARGLGLTIPSNVLRQATEVIP